MERPEARSPDTCCPTLALLTVHSDPVDGHSKAGIMSGICCPPLCDRLAHGGYAATSSLCDIGQVTSSSMTWVSGLSSKGADVAGL